jgi:hypothetical protein
MGNFFSSLGNLKDNNKLSWKEVFIMGIIPLGQLYARVEKFKGSLDKWWLMFPLLLFPPLSFIPLIMMKFNLVADGKGSKPIDYNILIPIIAKLIIPFALPLIGINEEDSGVLFSIVNLVLMLITTMIANLIRRNENCKGITFNSVGKAGMDSTIALAGGEITTFAIGYVPLLGTVISILKSIPFIGSIINQLIWAVGFTGTYVVKNMFNQDNMNKFCSSPFIGNSEDRIPFIVSFVLLIAINFVFKSIF